MGFRQKNGARWLRTVLRSSLNRHRGLLLARPFEIRCQQPGQDFVIAEIVRPPMGIKHGSIQPLVRQVQPGRALPLQLSQRADRWLARCLGAMVTGTFQT
jgi:hypothetical protein